MIELAFILVVFERCLTAENGKDWVCVSKPTPALTCFRNAQRFECIHVPYLARRMV